MRLVPSWLSRRLDFKASRPKASGSLFTETAFDRFLALVSIIPDPDEILKRAGITRDKLRQLSHDDEVSAAMDTRREALIGTPWRLEAKAEGEQVDFVAAQLAPWMEEILSGAMEALPYGYSVLEAVYKRVDGRIGFEKIAEKPFEWFAPQRDGSLLYLSASSGTGEVVPADKFFVTQRRATYRNPYGESLYSRLYWAWFFRAHGWRFWAKWLERFGTPLLLGTSSSVALADVSALADALGLAVQDAAIAVGAGSSVTAVESKAGAGHFEAFERACCARIQKVILGQTLTTDSGGSSGKSGSYALGQVHNEVRLDRRNADIRMVSRTAQSIVNVLWSLNAFAGEPPIFIMRDDTGLEADRAERDAKLMREGLKLTKDYFTRAYDYEDEDIDEDAMNAPVVPAAPGASPSPDDSSPADPKKKANVGKPADVKAGTVFGTQFTPTQQAIEDALDPVIARALPPISQDDIREAIIAAASPEDLAQRLAVLMNGRSLQEFEDTLAKCIFAADVLGYVHAEESKHSN